MKAFWQKLSGKKTYIGIIAGTVLAFAVEWSTDDSLTWESPNVVRVGALILAWTGVAVRSAIAKNGK